MPRSRRSSGGREPILALAGRPACSSEAKVSTGRRSLERGSSPIRIAPSALPALRPASKLTGKARSSAAKSRGRAASAAAGRTPTLILPGSLACMPSVSTAVRRAFLWLSRAQDRLCLLRLSTDAARNAHARALAPEARTGGRLADRAARGDARSHRDQLLPAGTRAAFARPGQRLDPGRGRHAALLGDRPARGHLQLHRP